MRVSGQRHTPAEIYPHERTPGMHWIEGWVGLRAGLDTEDRGKILCLCRGSILVFLSVVRKNKKTCLLYKSSINQVEIEDKFVICEVQCVYKMARKEGHILLETR
jgi:hypothetical protein